MSCNVLLTGINSSPALNVIRYLKRQDRYEVKIIGCDITEYTAGRMLTDQFYKIPKHDAQNLLPALLDICHREKVDIIIPIFEPEMLIISENRELFAGIKIVLPAKETVRLCLDKDKTLRFFADNYIPTCKVYEKDEVGTGAFPLFIKPRVGDSSRGTMVIRDREALSTHYSPEEHVLCEFLEGDEYTIDIYCQRAGEVTCLLARKRLEIVDGMATRAETYQDPRLFKYCREIMNLLKYEGVCCLQCIYDSDYRFLEINTRFGGSTNLTLEAGYNIPLYILNDYQGDEIELPTSLRKLYMVKYYENAYWEI